MRFSCHHTATVVYPPRAPVPRLDLRRVGRIRPGAEIIRAPKYDITYLYCGRKFLHQKHKIGSFRWWKPKNGYYGLMRRMYSKKHDQWGWTTDGLDWYSESECNFVTSPRGRFFGEVHRQPRRILGSLNSGRSGSIEYNDADYDDGDFSGGDDDGGEGAEDGEGGDDGESGEKIQNGR
ncbi:hypothetical protein BJV82DRAFT_168932 [Fennellomyces sp. T-0311]|nr:hypothetical protein BJV82DRAFT_168932 [Fennellomyces sp. T-0311]